MMKRKSSRRNASVVSDNRKGYDEVAYTRKGVDRVLPLGSGRASERKVSTVWVTTRNGQKWEVPVDSRTGRVPDEYLFGRFLDVQSGIRGDHPRNIVIDMGKDADMIHEIPEGGFTPKQLIETGWWQYPNESDIAGIDDTEGARFARELEEASKTARSMGKKMVFLMPEASAQRARSILTRDFNSSEIKKAVRNGGIIIKEGNPGRGASGCYISKQEACSLKTPVIILGRDWDEETLVHEFTHHLRHVDDTREGLTRTPFVMNDKGERVSSDSYRPDEFNSMRNLEEASTVAESLARIQSPSEGANGYYACTRAKGNSPYDRYLHDRRLMAGDPGSEKPLKGRKAERKVKNKFEDTSISHLGYYRPGTNAGRCYDDLKSKGRLPKASRKKGRKASDSADAGKVPSGAVVSGNRRSLKKRRRRYRSSPGNLFPPVSADEDVPASLADREGVQIGFETAYRTLHSDRPNRTGS